MGKLLCWQLSGQVVMLSLKPYMLSSGFKIFHHSCIKLRSVRYFVLLDYFVLWVFVFSLASFGLGLVLVIPEFLLVLFLFLWLFLFHHHYCILSLSLISLF